MASAETYAGLRVLELTTTIAGPFAAMILGDLGADVVKVERPGRGDDSRSMPPHRGSESAVFHSVNRGKRSVVLDLKAQAGRAAFLRLADTADVVVQSFRPGVADELGVGWAAVHARNPAAVYCSVSAFGDSGSASGLPGYDPLIQAFTGMMSMTGEPGRPPVRAAASLIDLSTGMWAAMAVMAALTRRTRTRSSAWRPPGRRRVADDRGRQRHPLRPTVPRVGGAELADDPRFAGSAARVAHRAVLHAAVQERLDGRSRAECLALLQGAGVPAGPVHDLAEAVAHPVAAERGIVMAAEPLPQVRLPIDDDRTRALARPPGLGDHTAEVLHEAGFSADEVRRLVAALPGGRASTSASSTR